MKAATEQSLRCLDSKLCPFASDFDKSTQIIHYHLIAHNIQSITPRVLDIVGHEMCRWTGRTRKGRPAPQLEKVSDPSWKSWKRSQTAKPAPQNLNKRCHQGNCLEDCCHQLFSSSQYKSTFDYYALIFVESSLKLPNDVNSCKMVATQLTGAVHFYHYWLLCSWISCQQANLDEDQLKLIVRKC